MCSCGKSPSVGAGSDLCWLDLEHLQHARQTAALWRPLAIHELQARSDSVWCGVQGGACLSAACLRRIRYGPDMSRILPCRSATSALHQSLMQPCRESVCSSITHVPLNGFRGCARARKAILLRILRPHYLRDTAVLWPLAVQTSVQARGFPPFRSRVSNNRHSVAIAYSFAGGPCVRTLTPGKCANDCTPGKYG